MGIRTAAAAVAFAAALSACANDSAPQGQTLADMVASNQAKLGQLSVGMSKAQVIAIMGSETAQTRDGVVNNPWTIETSSSGKATCEILFYLTRKNQPFTPVRKSLTTPVVIKNDRVIGWGAGVPPNCA